MRSAVEVNFGLGRSMWYGVLHVPEQIAGETTMSLREEAQGPRGFHRLHRETAMTIAKLYESPKLNLLYAQCTSLFFNAP